MAKSSKDVKYWWTYILSAKPDSTLTSRVYQEFPKLKSGEGQLKFHVKTLRMLGASLEVGSKRVKDDGKAQGFRNVGNDLFSSNGETAKVAEMYTKSIAYALPGSQELALAYANRSAVSFKAGDYEKCLIDIERSLENGYPEEMKAKLHARKVRCLVVLKKPQTEIEKALKDTREALLKMDRKASGRDLVEKTLTEQNHMAPTASTKKTMNTLKPTIPQDDSCDIRGASGITIRYSKKYGRHVVATRDIKSGEIIAVIDTYANARSPDKCYRECTQCTEPTTIGIPCDHCVNVIYCSTSCRNKAWNDYHEIECPILGILLDLDIPTNALLGIKITLKALQEAGGILELKKMVKKIDSVSDPRVRGFTDNVFDCTKYACIYTLASYTGNKRNTEDSYYISLISTLTLYYLATLTEIFGKKYDEDLGIFNRNPLLIFFGELMIKNCEIVQMTGLREGETGNDVTVAPFTALCNHSCDSNVTCLGNNKSIAFALQPIKAGQQIWDNYLCLHFSRFPRAKRQKLLKRDYHFTCECVACTNNWPMLEKLPEAVETPGLPPSIRALLSEAKKTFLQKYSVVMPTGNILDAKDQLSRLLDLIYQYACPSREMVTYRDILMTMYGAGFDPS